MKFNTAYIILNDAPDLKASPLPPAPFVQLLLGNMQGLYDWKDCRIGKTFRIGRTVRIDCWLLFLWRVAFSMDSGVSKEF